MTITAIDIYPSHYGETDRVTKKINGHKECVGLLISWERGGLFPLTCGSCRDKFYKLWQRQSKSHPPVEGSN